MLEKKGKDGIAMGAKMYEQKWSKAKKQHKNNLLVKILGLIDKRVGKRTLARIKDTMQTESELIQYFYRLRCEAEGIK